MMVVDHFISSQLDVSWFLCVRGLVKGCYSNCKIWKGNPLAIPNIVDGVRSGTVSTEKALVSFHLFFHLSYLIRASILFCFD